MPRFSVVVNAYNVSPYIVGTLQSLKNQTFSDFECIVIDDCSTDNTKEVIETFIQDDTRFRLCALDQNSGLHYGRVVGVQEATGDYITFLDGDDEFDPAFFEHGQQVLAQKAYDIVSLGVETIADGVSEEHLTDFVRRVRHGDHEFDPVDMFIKTYDEDEGFILDWRMTTRLFKKDLIKQAFSLMKDDGYLIRAEDCYEYFVILAHKPTSCYARTLAGYRYFYGRGMTGDTALSLEAYNRSCFNLARCHQTLFDRIPELLALPDAFSAETLYRCFKGSLAQCLMLMGNELYERFEPSQRRQAASIFARHFGPLRAAGELWRHTRDNSYAFSLTHNLSQGSEAFAVWKALAEEMDTYVALFEQNQQQWPEHLQIFNEIFEPSVLLAPHDIFKTYDLTDRNRHSLMKARALQICSGISSAQLRSERDASPIRIFVSDHIGAQHPHSKILQPMQVGCAAREDRLVDCYYDNEGDNISELNPYYCELTTQYWAYKHARDAEYVGFCHYRRYFDFSEDPRHTPNDYGEIMCDNLSLATQELYGLSDETITRVCEGYDVITTKTQDLKTFPGQTPTVFDHYKAAPKLHVEDLKLLEEIIAERSPEYLEDWRKHIHGSKICFCNMFIMRRAIFEEYSAWLFDLLEVFMQRWDRTHLSVEALRTPGHLGERLVNVFLLHAERTGRNFKRKELGCIHVVNPMKVEPLLPVADNVSNVTPTVPVVFAADHGYVPQLSTILLSLARFSNPRRRYDVVILERNICNADKYTMECSLKPWPHISLRFANVASYLEDYHLETSNAHISVETYYRFILQDILQGYDKVLYLDSDMIIQHDVAELYDTELGDNLLGAVIDADYLGNLNYKDGHRMRYTTKTLKLKNPYGYFQAGVLLLNVAQMKVLHSTQEWLEIAQKSQFIYDDQDILNTECQGRVLYLDMAWNVMHDCCGRIPNVISFAPAEVFKAYTASRACPYIIHYAGGQKPWNDPYCDLADRWWEIAQTSPFIQRLWPKPQITAAQSHRSFARRLVHSRKIRRLADILLPPGTRRRERIRRLALRIVRRG